MSAAEVALVALLDRPSLVLPDDQHLLVLELGEARDHRPVVAKGAVAVQLDELVKDQLDVIEGLGPGRVPRDLDDIRGVELFVQLPKFLLDLGSQRADGFPSVWRVADVGFERGELPLPLVNVPFKSEFQVRRRQKESFQQANWGD